MIENACFRTDTLCLAKKRSELSTLFINNTLSVCVIPPAGLVCVRKLSLSALRCVSRKENSLQYLQYAAEILALFDFTVCETPPLATRASGRELNRQCHEGGRCSMVKLGASLTSLLLGGRDYLITRSLTLFLTPSATRSASATRRAVLTAMTHPANTVCWPHKGPVRFCWFLRGPVYACLVPDGYLQG